MKWPAIALAAMMLIMLLPTAQAAPTTLAVTIDTASAGPGSSFQAFDGTPPMVFDFDGDGIQEIVVHNDNRRVYVFDSQDGTLNAEITTKYPPGWGARPINGVEAAVLEYGGVPHLVVANSAAYITVLRYEDGPSSKGDFRFTKMWDTRLDACHANPGMDAKPVLYDLDDDGQFEILAQTEEVGVFALRMDGSTKWHQCIGGGNGEPAVDDLDGNGIPEVVWASDGGVITVMNGALGTTRCTYWANHPSFNLHSASVPVGPTIGQVDGIGGKDIVFGARDSHDANDWDNDHAALFVISPNCNLIWMRQDPNGNPLTYTHPIVTDIDGDGSADIFWADWNTVGHKPPFPGDDPGPWAGTGPANFYRYAANGDLVWRTELNTYWSNKDIAIADVDDDGVQEVLANGPGASGDGIWYLNALTGAKEQHVSTHPWKVTRGPIVEDLWGTGTMQWVVPVSAAAPSVSGGGILVFDTHAPYDAAWPHLPYPIVTQGSNPPPDPTFPVTFTLSGSVNNWWVDVTTDSPQTVQSVTASVDGGPPVNLPATSWGSWAKSFYVPTGAAVIFTASNAAGDTTASQTYYWLTGTPPPPPGDDFEATLSPTNINNWWVEVGVEGTQPVSKVFVSVDGGPDKSLVKQSWGHWAKSFFVPDGSGLVFTAENAAGEQVVSSTYYPLGPPPPPPDANLSVDFIVPGNVNNWWVEVDPNANHVLTSVTATVEGGAPKALTKQSWGNWAKSFYVPTGASVVFDVVDEHGHTASGDPILWLDDGGDFSATFTPGDTTNNWWVETYVASNRPLSTVEVQVDGAAWQALPATSWGSYAKSFFVPDGASVVFRATSTGGDVATSAPYTWG